MWRTVLGCSVVLYAVISNVTTAPMRFNQNYLRQNLKIGQTTTYHLEVQPSKKPYLEVHNATFHGNGPREEARAMCSVRTQEVNATANATITRRIHGVVTSKELHTAVMRLEVVIYGQMQQLWRSMDALRAELTGNQRASVYPSRNTVSFRYKPHGP